MKVKVTNPNVPSVDFKQSTSTSVESAGRLATAQKKGPPKFPAGIGRRHMSAPTSANSEILTSDQVLSPVDVATASLQGPSTPSPSFTSSSVTLGRRRGPSSLLSEINLKIAEYEAKLKLDGTVMSERRREEVRNYLSAPALVLVPSGFAEYIWPGISMSDIARSTGMTLGGISRIFNGKRKARRHTLISIANLYTDGDVAAVEEVIRLRVEGRNRRKAG